MVFPLFEDIKSIRVMAVVVPQIVPPNHLNREFVVNTPDTSWVTDITYIRTWQGWLYLAVVFDLYSRKVIGWSIKSTLAKDIVLDALLMAVWRRRPNEPVIIHSDQGSQYSSGDWQKFCQKHNLVPSMYESSWKLLGQCCC